MLRAKCIKANIEPVDGLRISVMSRHTLEDGVTIDKEINENTFDEWWKVLSPPDDLVGSYYKRGLGWDKFSQKYLDYLGSIEPITTLSHLANMALTQNVTVMCVEESSEYCHRKLLVEKCKLILPDIIVAIN